MILGVIVVLVLLSAPPTSRVAVTGSTAHRSGSANAAFADNSCPDMVGTTQWTGLWNYGSATPINPWSATLIVGSDGTVRGTVTVPGVSNLTNAPMSGILNCATVSFTTIALQIGATGDISGTGSTFSATGTWIDPGFSGTWTATVIATPAFSITPSTLPVTAGPVSYSATVSGNGPTPTGSVAISDDHGGSCSIPLLVGGTGSCSMTESASSSPYAVTGSYAGDPNYAPATASVSNTAAVTTNGSATAGSDQVAATATGGTNGVDTINEAEYGTNPVGSLTNGKSFFDVAVSTGNTFASVMIQDCNQVTPSDLLLWWDPTANGGAGGWASVVGNPGPTYEAGPPACLSATLDSSTTPSISELTGTVFGAVLGRAFTSVGGATTYARSSFSQIVTTTGKPVPTIRAKGKLPKIRLVDHHNGTATLYGTPTTGGVFHPVITATYGRGKTKEKVVQTFALFVFQAPRITIKGHTSATVGKLLLFDVRTKGFPGPTISESGSLPSGVSVTTTNGDTAVFQGTPSPGSAGSYPITVSAENGIGNASRTFSLVVKP